MSHSITAAFERAVDAATPRLPDATRSTPGATAAWYLIKALRKRQADGLMVVQPEKQDGEPGWRVQVSLREFIAGLSDGERDGASEASIRRYLADTRNLVQLTRGARPVWWLPDLADGWRDVPPGDIERRRRMLKVVKTAPSAGQGVLEEDPDGDDWGAVSKAAMVHACTYCPTGRYRTDQERRTHERDEHPGAYWSNTALICVRGGCEYPARSEAAYRNHLSIVHRCDDKAEQDTLCRQAKLKHDRVKAESAPGDLPAPRPQQHLRPAAEAGANVLVQARAAAAGEELVTADDFRTAVELLPEITAIITRYHAQHLLVPA